MMVRGKQHSPTQIARGASSMNVYRFLSFRDVHLAARHPLNTLTMSSPISVSAYPFLAWVINPLMRRLRYTPCSMLLSGWPVAAITVRALLCLLVRPKVLDGFGMGALLDLVELPEHVEQIARVEL